MYSLTKSCDFKEVTLFSSDECIQEQGGQFAVIEVLIIRKRFLVKIEE